MQTTDLRELLDTVEAIRAEKHADLDAGFLGAVVRAEEENPDDDAEAIRAIEAALKTLLGTTGAT